MAMEYVVQRLEMGDVVLSTFLSARRSLLCAVLEQPAMTTDKPCQRRVVEGAVPCEGEIVVRAGSQAR